MKEIAKGSSVMTAVSIGEMLMRFIRTKFIALFLGTSGMGFLAQITVFFEALRVLGDLGARRAVIKQVAEQRFKGTATPKYRQVLKTSFFLVLTASGIAGIAIAIFCRPISYLLYGDSSYYPFILFLAALLPLASFSTVLASVVKGNLDYGAYARYTLAAYLGVIVLIPILIYAFKIWGAVVAMALFFVFPLIAYCLLDLKKKFLHFSKRISPDALKEQFSQGFTQIYQDAMTHVIRISVAAWIVRALGLDSMGIYQVVITFTTVYMAVPIHAMSGYVFPLIAGSNTNQEINNAVNDSFRYLMFVLVPVIALIMILPEPLIYLLYSGEFLAAVPILRTQIFSTLFLLMSYSLLAALTAKGKLKSVAIVSTCHVAIFFALLVFLFPKWGLMGVAVSFSTATLCNAILQLFFSRHYFKTRIYPKNQRLLLMTFAWIGTSYLALSVADPPLLRGGLLACGFLWFMVSSKDHERRFLYEKIEFYFKKLRRVEFAQRKI